eukprot:scaffold36555_cov51-Attheya_sp.AAC.8
MSKGANRIEVKSDNKKSQYEHEIASHGTSDVGLPSNLVVADSWELVRPNKILIKYVTHLASAISKRTEARATSKTQAIRQPSNIANRLTPCDNMDDVTSSKP